MPRSDAVEEAEPVLAVREQLAGTVASAAGPYGYTISLGGATGLAVDRLGSPHLAGALALMTGAVVAFLALELLARSDGHRAEPAPPPPSMLANAHIPSAGLALVTTWALVRLTGGELAWGLAGFGATFVYFFVTALQRIVIGAVRGHRPDA